ncbi:MAG: restriction endonuclease [Anaerolineales bacterium]|nr:restriction endonuclease [Anaerolineales bacterium]
MNIAGRYSFNGGKELIEAKYAIELREVEQVIVAVDSAQCRTKTSREKTMPGKVLYSPRALNKAFRRECEALGWLTHRVRCEYSAEYYVSDYIPNNSARGAFREIDFVKNRVGLEVQFGKYAFMVYNVCAKMTIFHKMDLIDVGIEIVPLKVFAEDMSSGVSYFEQFVWDLEHRGVADIDIPVLILGVIA